jgi:hypothetical protein
MSALDLSGLRTVIGDLFLADKGTLTRDNGVADDELDEESGDLTPSGPRAIYTGTGSVQPVGGNGGRGVPDLDVAVAPLLTDTTHRLMLPLVETAGLDIQVGDVWTQTEVLGTLGDKDLEGRKFRVNELPDASSFAVVRFVFLKPLFVAPQAAPYVGD